MTVSTFYQDGPVDPIDANDGRIKSTDNTYSVAAAGGTLSSSATATLNVGQDFNDPTYECFEAFVKFDTSAIGTDSISAAVLSLYGLTNGSGPDPDMEARSHDWGATLTDADWVAAADLSGKTRLGVFDGTFSTVAYNDFTSDAAFLTEINKTGITYIIVNSDRHRAQTTSVNNEYYFCQESENAGETQDPKLVVTHGSGSPWYAYAQMQ